MSPCSNDDYETVPEEMGGAESVHRRCLNGRQVEEVYDVDDEVSVSSLEYGTLKSDESNRGSQFRVEARLYELFSYHV